MQKTLAVAVTGDDEQPTAMLDPSPRDDSNAPSTHGDAQGADDAERALDPLAEASPPDIEASGSEESYYDDEPEPNGFATLGLSDEIVRAVTDAGYVTPTPIQDQAIPIVLMGRDVLGSAQTGTGKTASFVLPMLDILSSGRSRARMPRSLILEPTRELAAQVAENFVKYAKYLRFEHALIIGGESMDEQVAKLTRGVDVLIATPGRLIDLFDRGGLILSDTRILVIDEADRMLDMGFIPDVERIVAMLPRMRQTLFFSATMAPEIRRLADAFLQNPKVISASKPATVATTVTQGLLMVAADDKREALRRLLREEDVKNALIFCNRKRDVDILYKSLVKHGFNAGALHGDMPQPKRTETLERFKAGKLALLVCSDVAARGIDISDLSHVFNFDVPHHAEDYVHRIGRTGRAGREGRAFTLGTREETKAIAAIEKLTGKPIPRMLLPGLDAPVAAEGDEAASYGREGGRGRDRGRGRNGSSRVQRADAPSRGQRADVPRAEAPRIEPTRAETPRPVAARPEPRVEAPRVADAPRAETPRGEPPRGEPRPRKHEPSTRRDAQPRRSAEPVRFTSTHTPLADPADSAREGQVVGFGTDIPAFMLIPIPRPRSAPSDDTED